LVGPGQVDTDLKSETTEEAAKFGNLLSVNIIQVPNVPEHETVQIFCEVLFIIKSPDVVLQSRFIHFFF
jgi:hypothetical protein